MDDKIGSAPYDDSDSGGMDEWSPVAQFKVKTIIAKACARWAAAGSDPAYTSAFFKALSGERGHLLWDTREAEAYRRLEAVRSERA